MWDWILKLNMEMTAQDQEYFYHNNALRCFFAEEGAKAANHPWTTPEWVKGQLDQESKVYVFPNNPIHIPMVAYNALLTDYLNQSRLRPEVHFEEYIVERLCRAK